VGCGGDVLSPECRFVGIGERALMGSNDNRPGVVAVAQKVCESEFEKVFLCCNKFRAFDILDVVAQVFRALRLWVVSTWALSQTAIVAAPSAVTFATLELVGCPKVSPSVDVDVSGWQGAPWSVIIRYVVIPANAMSTAAVWTSGASAANSSIPWEALAYAGLEIACATTTALAIRVLVVEGRTRARRRIRRKGNPCGHTWGEAIHGACESNSLRAQSMFATFPCISFVADPFFRYCVILRVGDVKRFSRLGLQHVQFVYVCGHSSGPGS